MSLTRADLRRRVSGAIGLDNTSGSEEQELVDGWLDEAVEQFLVETGAVVNVATADLVEGQVDYRVSDHVLSLKDAYLNDDEEPLERILPGDALRARARAVAGGTRLRYAYDGSDLILFDREPADGDVLTLLYVPRPTEWASPTSEPPISPQYRPAIESYAKMRAAEYDDKTTGTMARDYEAQWEKAIVKARMDLNRRKGRRGAPLVPGPRRRQVVAREGQDTFI